MEAGLKSFRRYVKDAGGVYTRTIAVLGDMLELGPEEVEYHRSVGGMLPELKIDLVCTVGRLAEHIGTAAVEAGLEKNKVHHFADAKAVGEFMIGNTLRGDIAYLKASRAIALEKMFEVLKERAAKKN
jgi:UDP-N-acetylmuramoyl-tripeptide--D-alanyl-D-alanine ligase